MNTEFINTNILLAVEVAVTFLLTVEAVWIMHTTQVKKVHGKRGRGPKEMKIAVVFPAYKDVVDIRKWLDWSRGTQTEYFIAEDITDYNDINSGHAAVLHRSTREGFKAGALNSVFEYMLKNRMVFDYVLMFDADHIPANNSVREIYPHLDKDILQFFWDDGLPKKGLIDWLTYSSRFYSNWNNYNRSFSNLTGSALAIRYALIEDGLRFPDSITEDYALTLHSLHRRDIRVHVAPLTISIGRSPANFRAFVKQQLRWAEGTLRDAGREFRRVFTHEGFTMSDRMAFLLHANMYLQGLWTVLSFVMLGMGVRISMLIVPILVLQAAAYLKTLDLAPKRYWPAYLGLNYLMVCVQALGIVRAVALRNSGFYKTEKNLSGIKKRPEQKEGKNEIRIFKRYRFF